MKRLALLVSPRAKSAYFNDYLRVSQAELACIIGDQAIVHRQVAAMDFFDIEVDAAQLERLASLSFVHGLFERDNQHLVPLDTAAPFTLHEDFVFGAKFKGKTNETLTQLLINVGLSHLGERPLSTVKLLDPMCGRGTTLLWAMRYGIKSRGIEQESKALAEIRQNIKKWCKIHRQKHKLSEGFVGGKRSKGEVGKFIEFAANDCVMRVITGDAANAVSLLSKEKFDLLVTDIPYGVQHFTTRKTRNPLDVLKACAPGWRASLKPGGVIVIAFNSYLPKRDELVAAFCAAKEPRLQAMDFRAPHRMSESIVRDILVLKRV